MADEPYDIVIVGAGPAGLSAAIFARARTFKVAVLEAGSAGGQLTALFPEKPLYNVPAVASSLAGEYAGSLIRQAQSEGAELYEGETAHRLEIDGNGVLAAVTDDRIFRGKLVILATGMGRMEPRRLGVEGEEEMAGRELVYAVTRARDFTGQRVLVVGGGDAAVDNALLLSGQASQVVLAHRGNSFKAQQRNLDQLPHNGVRIYTETQVAGLERATGHLVARLICGTGKSTVSLEVDRVVVNVGLVPNPGPLADWGLRLEGKLIAVDSEMKTNLPGILACGDAVTYPGKLKMVVTAVGEAATAVNTGHRILQARGQR